MTILVEKARRVLPGLRNETANRRIGRRPLTLDTKPIIGRIGAAPPFICATGHGQIGVTLTTTPAARPRPCGQPRLERKFGAFQPRALCRKNIEMTEGPRLIALSGAVLGVVKMLCSHRCG